MVCYDQLQGGGGQKGQKTALRNIWTTPKQFQINIQYLSCVCSRENKELPYMALLATVKQFGKFTVSLIKTDSASDSVHSVLLG